MPESTLNKPVEPDTAQKKRRRPLWRRLLKWTLVTLGVSLAVIAAAISAIVFYLSPERLTPLVNRYGSEYLIADVDARRVELTFWSTFPRLNIEVSDLKINSRSLDGIPDSTRASLPADADSLLRIERISGGINLVKLLVNHFELYDVEIANPRVNLLVVNDSITNFDIVPKSGEEPEESAPIPEISINCFEIAGNLDVRYRQPSDSADVSLCLSRTLLGRDASPTYIVGVTGLTDTRFGSFPLPPMPFTIDGRIDWNANRPELLGLKEFRINALDIPLLFNTEINMADTLTVRSLDFQVDRIDVGSLLEYIPAEYTAPLKKLSTDLSISLNGNLTRAYRPTVEQYPYADIWLKATASEIRFDRLNIHRFKLDAEASLKGDDLDRAELTLRQLDVAGKAMEFSLSGEVTHPVSDPRVRADFSGTLALDRLPAALTDRLQMTLAGTLKGNATARFRLSDLTPKRFHRARIDGKLTLSSFAMRMADESMSANLRNAEINLGTSSSIAAGDRMIDSMLTASLRIDTATIMAPGVELATRNLSGRLGMRNVASSSDTTQINPIGASITVGLLGLTADSGATRLRLYEALVGASINRYEGKGRSALVKARIEASRLNARTKEFRGNLRGTVATLEMHPRARRPMSAAMQARVDSLAVIYPGLTADSLLKLARRQIRRSAEPVDDGRVNLDFGVDKSLASWMRLWDVSGEMKTRSVRAFTPAFPTRTRLRDVDVAFSVDSVVVHKMMVNAGRSDFRVSGAVRNIRRSLTSRRHSPIDVEFNMASDTIDVNDLTATLLRGAAYMKLRYDSVPPAVIADDLEDMTDDPVPSAIEEGAAALLVPSNVNGRFSMRADNILYGDLWFRDFVGGVSIYDGAVSLEQLSARTDIGSIDLTALYSAPTADQISVAAGLRLNRLNLRHVLREMPQVDSLLPMLRSLQGIVDGRLAFTARLDSLMDIDLSSVDMVLRLSGDSLVVLDSETFRKVAKWMLFKNKQRNMIDHMDVEMTVHNGWVDLYPVIFDMDRYRLGIVGNNDMRLNLDYHVAVLKSPIPFKFGINIKGNPDKLKIRLGKARINERTVASTRHVADSLRVNLISEMRKVFRRGVRTAGTRGLRMQLQARAAADSTAGDTLSAADSLIMIREGIIEAPVGFVMPSDSIKPADTKTSKSKKKR